MEELNKKQLIELSTELKEKINNDEHLTAEEQCRKNHAGQCGACDSAGYFTPCG
jgi:hypothetical protein